MLKRLGTHRCAATAAVGLLVACSGSSQSTAPPTSATLGSVPSSGAVEPIARRLDASPEGCDGPAPHYERIARYFGSLAGGSPIWGGFYARFDEETNAFHGTQAPLKNDGWRIKVLWVIDPDASTPVTLSGRNTATDAPLKFETSGGGEVATNSPVLDPANPAIPIQDGNWKEFPSYVYFPSAGCYVLSASWSGGSWQMGFGFGR